MSLTTAQYFSGQGRVLTALRDDNGRPLAFSLFGDCSGAKLEMGADTTDIHESMSGSRLLAAQIPNAKSMKLTLTAAQFSKVSAALGFYSELASVTAGTVTGEELPTDLAAGDEIALKYGNVSDLVLTDSTGTPVTLTKGTQYKENSLTFGNIGILQDKTDGSYTEPVKAAYSYATCDRFPMFSKTPEDRYIRIEGLNTAESNKPVLIEIYKGRPQPFASVDWISDGQATQDLPIGCLYDPLNGSDDAYGYFGRVTFL